ncbi:hypothetical protein GDO86_007932 [Hymenochirus boettgeri]|uniref:Cyanocobalamin reductase / alkylcobalamin dealkylase n=1 Tax=Hymenochirus boettgeri TaxID=247094 RepID=A0A8T2J0W4_9PIPI|nr:hypothetical protein GDO86_007932 [Hymenochirus boettgeri]
MTHVGLKEQLQKVLDPFGFEVYPFKIGWYNAVLEPTFYLSYNEDTLAFVILSTPSMFEKAFKPFLNEQKLEHVRDPIDQCVAYHMSLVKEKIYGVCIHPQFGGWFAIRAVLVFTEVQAPALEHTLPLDCLPSHEQRIQLLEQFNFNWKDGKYRDVFPPKEKYSPEQTLYFATPPAERRKLLETWGQLHSSPAC